MMPTLVDVFHFSNESSTFTIVMQNKVYNFCKKKLKLTTRTPVLLAVSGGSDSMALATIFLQSKMKFGVAHCNFNLRKNESEQDKAFVKKWCDEHHIPFYSIDFDTTAYAKNEKLNIQEAARILRYRWFELVRKEHGYEYVATAHHANDVAETLLYNFTKGTTIKGLSGISSFKNRVIRPIINCTKNEIEEYINEQNVQYREDSSNKENKYSRNYIRNDIFPRLKKINPTIEETLANKAIEYSETYLLLHELVNDKSKKIIQKKDSYETIALSTLKNSVAPNVLLFYVLEKYGFNLQQCKDILGDQNDAQQIGKSIFSSTHTVIRDRKELIIALNDMEQFTPHSITRKDRRIKAFHKVITFHFLPAEALSEKNYQEKNTILIDADLLEFPLLLRTWQQGDFLYPKGMNMKKKKVSDVFTQAKMNQIEKREALLLFSNNKLVAILGLIADERFNTTNHTKNVLKISIH